MSRAGVQILCSTVAMLLGSQGKSLGSFQGLKKNPIKFLKKLTKKQEI